MSLVVPESQSPVMGNHRVAVEQGFKQHVPDVGIVPCLKLGHRPFEERMLHDG